MYYPIATILPNLNKWTFTCADFAYITGNHFEGLLMPLALHFGDLIIQHFKNPSLLHFTKICCLSLPSALHFVHFNLLVTVLKGSFILGWRLADKEGTGFHFSFDMICC